MNNNASSLASQAFRFRRHYLRFLSVLGLVTTSILVPLFFVWNLTGTAVVLLLYVPVCIIVIWGSHRNDKQQNFFVNAFLCATLLDTLGGLYFQRQDAISDPWILICPVASFALCKRQMAAMWTALTLLGLFAVRQIAPYPSTPASTVLLALAMIAISILLYLFSAHIEKYERLIVDLGNTDSLTNTLNRRSFHDVLQSEFRRGSRQQSPMTVFMIDVDLFKQYNDRYGHVCGDSVLVRIADALKQTAKRSGDFVFRYGGEEFCILCSGLDTAQAAAFAEQLRANVEALALEHEDSPIGRISISVGYRHADVLVPLTPDRFVEEADKALYLAKAKGRNRVERYLNVS